MDHRHGGAFVCDVVGDVRHGGERGGKKCGVNSKERIRQVPMDLLGGTRDDSGSPDRGCVPYLEPHGAGDSFVLRAACHGV